MSNLLNPLMPVDNPVIGKKYHVSWAKNGCVWKCIDVNLEAGTVTLRTPKTKKILNNIKISDLRHTRYDQFRINRKLNLK